VTSIAGLDTGGLGAAARHDDGGSVAMTRLRAEIAPIPLVMAESAGSWLLCGIEDTRCRRLTGTGCPLRDRGWPTE
jgi:hypothetical protein